MATQDYVTKLFIFSKTAHTGLSATFNRKKVHRLSMTKTPKNINGDVRLAFLNLLTRFDYEDFDFCYAYLVEDSTEQERLMMTLKKNDTDYVALIRDHEDSSYLRIYADLLDLLTNSFNDVDAIQNTSIVHIMAVGLSVKKMQRRLNLLLDEISNNIGLTLEKFDAKFRI